MKKSFKEKYFELKKENEYLISILKDKVSDFHNLELQFFNFKSDLKKKEERTEKQSFIIFVICFSLTFAFGLVSLILNACGLF